MEVLKKYIEDTMKKNNSFRDSLKKLLSTPQFNDSNWLKDNFGSVYDILEDLNKFLNIFKDLIEEKSKNDKK